MKKLNLFFKITTVVMAITMTFVTIYICKIIYKKNFSYYSIDYEYSDRLAKLYFDNSKYVLQDKFTLKKTSPKLDWISTPEGNDTLVVFSLQGKRGYIDVNTGLITISEQYEHAWDFSEGLGAVVLNGKVGFIDKYNKLIIPFKFSYFRNKDKAVDFLFRDGICTVIDATGKQGLINKKGEWVLNPTYDYINKPINGYRIYKQNKHYGLLDRELKPVLPAKYNNIEIQESGIRFSLNGEQKILAYDFQTILQPFVYDEIINLSYDTGIINNSGDGVIIDTSCFAYRINTYWGLMDKSGKVLTKAVYDNIKAVTANIFCCTIENYMVNIDSNGKITY